MKLKLKNTKRNRLYVKILELIKKDPYITTQKIAEITDRHRVTISESIKEMKDKKYISLEESRFQGKFSSSFKTPLIDEIVLV